MQSRVCLVAIKNDKDNFDNQLVQSELSKFQFIQISQHNDAYNKFL